MAWREDWKRRHWYVPFTQDELGGCIYGKPPILRRFFKPLLDHWLRHWKFWLNFAATWTAVFVAIVQVLRCKP